MQSLVNFELQSLRVIERHSNVVTNIPRLTVKRVMSLFMFLAGGQHLYLFCLYLDEVRVLHKLLPYHSVRLPLANNVLIHVYAPGWREALLELRAFPRVQH